MKGHMDPLRFLLRLVLGGLFIGHGTQKLFGWFGGGGLEKTAEAFDQMGLRPGRHHARAAGAAEAGGGALVAAGLATPLGAGVLTATMLTAIRTVHGKNGPWITNGGYEYNLVLIASLLALVEAGPGRLSVEGAIEHEHSGARWALAAALVGVLGALAVPAVVSFARAEPPTDSQSGSPNGRREPVGVDA